MIAINRESSHMLFEVASAVKDANAGQTAKAQTRTAEALRALDAILVSMHAAKYGKWKNRYRGDWLTGVYRTRELVQAYVDHLRDRWPGCPLLPSGPDGRPTSTSWSTRTTGQWMCTEACAGQLLLANNLAIGCAVRDRRSESSRKLTAL